MHVYNNNNNKKKKKVMHVAAGSPSAIRGPRTTIYLFLIKLLTMTTIYINVVYKIPFFFFVNNNNNN